MSTEQGPLSISLNLSETKTAFPVIQHDVYAKWRLVAVKQDRNEKGAFLKWEWHLVEPVPNADGGQIIPGEMGSKFFENIQLYAKPDATDPKWFEKKIATRVDALLGTGDPGNPKDKPVRPNFDATCVAAMVNQIMVAKMKVSTYEGVTRNEFASVHFPPDLAAA